MGFLSKLFGSKDSKKTKQESITKISDEDKNSFRKEEKTNPKLKINNHLQTDIYKYIAKKVVEDIVVDNYNPGYHRNDETIHETWKEGLRGKVIIKGYNYGDICHNPDIDIQVGFKSQINQGMFKTYIEDIKKEYFEKNPDMPMTQWENISPELIIFKVIYERYMLSKKDMLGVWYENKDLSTKNNIVVSQIFFSDIPLLEYEKNRADFEELLLKTKNTSQYQISNYFYNSLV